MTTICTLTNPLTWPHFPVLPVAKRGGSPFDEKNVGLVFAGQNLATIPTVYLTNLYAAAGKSIGDIMKNSKCVTYNNLGELEADWRID